MRSKALTGVLYFLSSTENSSGIILDSAIENIARLPPVMNEFQLVTTPQKPPAMSTFAITVLLNIFSIAEAVTRPDSSIAAAISDEFKA